MRNELTAFILACAALAPRTAFADEDPKAPATTAPAPAEDETTLAARKEFVEGTALVRAERWGEALAAFERAAKLKEHAITTYNIAQCERAMGQFTRARQALGKALAQHEASKGAELPDSVVTEAKALGSELDRILPRVTVTLAPADAAIAIDGRRLEPTVAVVEGPATFVAGTMPPGPGKSPGPSTFTIVANPGAHVVTVSRQGYQDVVVTRTFAPGASTPLDLQLDRLPATLHVTSNLADAVVRVNDSDVGNAPVEVSRIAGRYRVFVSRKGFLPFETELSVRPGERAEIDAALKEDKPALTQRWWFWAGIGVVAVGVATATYFAARSSADPQRPPTDGGGLGWSLQVP